MRNPLGDLRGRALWVVLGCLVCQLGLGYGYTFGPLAPDILAEFGWTRAAYSAARAPQLFVIALASPLVGVATARFGARAVLTVSTLLLGVAFCLLSGIGALWQLYAITLVQGLVVAGLGDIAVGAVVAQWIERARGLALGLVYSGSNLGGFLLIRLASAIADHGSWRDAFFELGLGGALVILPFALWVVRSPRSSERSLSAAAPEADAVDARAADLDLRQALRTRSFWILAGALFVFFFYFVGMLEHLVLFLTDVGIPRSDAAAYFSNAILIGMASKLCYGFVADRMSEKSSLLLDYALLALSSLVLLALPRPGLLAFYLVVYGFATASRDVVYPLIIGYCFGVRDLARIYGVLMLALLPGGALGPIFAGFVHDRTGSYAIAFACFAVLNLLALSALGLVRRERGR